MKLDLLLLEEEFAICRLDPGDRHPGWASGDLVATVRTAEELSVVCPGRSVPEGVERSEGWRALRVAGSLDLSLTGVLVALLTPLERTGIPIFAVSSYETDYMLVPRNRLDATIAALRLAGHHVSADDR